GANAVTRAYPALADEGVENEVAVRPFDTPERAADAMAAGVRRLLALQVTKESRSLIATMPGFSRVALLNATLGRQEQLVEDLAILTAMMAFDSAEGSPPPTAEVRTRAEFDAWLEWGWGRLGACGRRAFDLAEDILSAHQRVAGALEGVSAKPATTESAVRMADIRAQLAHL